MADPFVIDGPTCLSFSGGRTSGYMLRRTLDANTAEDLAQWLRVCFANTGKEEEATLRFVREVGLRWNVPITWLEYRNDEAGFAVVDFDTASRQGEPYEAIIRKRNFLPNPIARFCTIELKIQPEHAFLRSVGWEEWDNFIGFRADEPKRVAKVRANPSGGKAGVERCTPLAAAGIRKADVGRFWKAQPFDLELPNINGVTYHGNCDLCFLKGPNQVRSLVAEKPERAVWWARMENSITNARIKDGGRFRTDRESYAAMHSYALAQDDAFGFDQLAPLAAAEPAMDCFCGDDA
jgi:3'-phosphoadenosine 5'-phosphosulfate sulfotransferase (PAPS reductase)/FAD synthetase